MNDNTRLSSEDLLLIAVFRREIAHIEMQRANDTIDPDYAITILEYFQERLDGFL